MRLSKDSKKAGLALVGSLAGFLAAKQLNTEDTFPFILIGGFIGISGKNIFRKNIPISWAAALLLL